MARHGDSKDEDPGLAPFFAAAQDTAPELSDDLFAAIMADAAAQQPRAEPVRPRAGMWLGLRTMLGGWSGFAGLASAALAGIAIGMFHPAPLDLLERGLPGALGGADSRTAALESYALEDMMPGFDALSEEVWQ